MVRTARMSWRQLLPSPTQKDGEEQIERDQVEEQGFDWM